MEEKKRGKGRVLMGLGLLFLAIAFVLMLRLMKEERDADAAAQRVLAQMTATVQPEATQEPPKAAAALTPQPTGAEHDADPAAQATRAPSASPETTQEPAATPLFTPTASASPETTQEPAATPLFTPQPTPSPTATAAPIETPRRALFEINPDMEMPITVIESHEYIGILEFPVLDLSLPVMSDWSYPKLKIAPCRYKGSAYTGDLIISGHNYQRHFGRFSGILPGDEIRFTDVDGNVLYYTVSVKETLDMRDVQGMLEGEWDMTLFTCVPGGAKRVTLRCRLERYEIAPEDGGLIDVNRAITSGS